LVNISLLSILEIHTAAIVIENIMSNSTDAILLIARISGGALAKDGREIWGMSAGTLWRCVDTLGPRFMS
jgi:hypothetical protein